MEVALNSNRICTTGIPGATLALLLVILSPSMSVLAEGSGDYTRHNIGVFLGAENEASGPTESTWGLEYGYRFTPHFGFGVVYEKTDEAHHGDGAEVLLGSLYCNPYANWRL